jgi:hypothetical protein
MPELSIHENESLASAIASVDPDSKDGYFPRLASNLGKGVRVPEVKITYRNLKVVVAATTSANALPSLPNVLQSMGKVRSVSHYTVCIASCRGGRCR